MHPASTIPLPRYRMIPFADGRADGLTAWASEHERTRPVPGYQAAVRDPRRSRTGTKKGLHRVGHVARHSGRLRRPHEREPAQDARGGRKARKTDHAEG